MSVVGIDGCKRGWIAVAVDGGVVVGAHHLRQIGEVAAAVPHAEVIAIDIPIGLPEVERRHADVAAKKFLGPRAGSVFFTPVRSAVESATHAEATAASVRETGVGLSQQSFALGKKILEVERWLPRAPCTVVEVHPELSFAVLLGGPATASKKTWAGMVERRQALAAAGLNLDRVDRAAASAASVDDMLDAAVAAWSAGRVAAGTARPFPEPSPSATSRGVATIWA